MNFDAKKVTHFLKLHRWRQHLEDFWCSFRAAIQRHVSIRRRQIIIHNTAFGSRDAFTFIEVQTLSRVAWRRFGSFDEGTRCNNCFSVQKGMLGQHNSFVWKDCSDVSFTAKGLGPRVCEIAAVGSLLWCTCRGRSIIYNQYTIILPSNPMSYLCLMILKTAAWYELTVNVGEGVCVKRDVD